MKYRKKPVVIEAVQYDGTTECLCELSDWIGVDMTLKAGDELVIHTPEGEMRVSPGDYIIRGVQGEFYPCKPDIFAATYEQEGEA